jgi:hypothetical protein
MKKIDFLARSHAAPEYQSVDHIIGPVATLQPLAPCFQSVTMAQSMRLEQAYPEIRFRWRSRNWWARLMRMPAECEHLENDGAWMATFIPDTLYLRGKASIRRRPARPEVSLCRACLKQQMEKELPRFPGRVIAFEPDSAEFTQYFFVGSDEFAAAGLQPEVANAISRRLDQPMDQCASCDRRATWLWISREEVPSLDDVARIALARAEMLCSVHGPQKLLESFACAPEANLFYVNAPYGESGAYVWI